MLVLGIDSATPAASVALADADGLAGEISLNRGLTHSQQLLPMIDALLGQVGYAVGQVEGLAVSSGPGSFTGLRIGMTLAKGLAQSLNVPIAGIGTLEAAACQAAVMDGWVSPMIDAFRGEVYAALYRKMDGALRLAEEPRGVLPEDWARRLLELGEPVALAGNGAWNHRSVWEGSGDRLNLFIHPMSDLRASVVAWMGRQKLLRGEQDHLYELKPGYVRSVEIGRRKDS
ncbi:MAG: tRNA (adenosine(37)-N6)-threonylcarbamoyltransferase complex dimerization subunit type 1 TsaB [Peptococcaceae bacterium]|jgi:tRNA threonylcarbamoyladenosine biosynthesis protein TsaB|nr:tRNA (adenosine(37)-N6)-threonylcarbamoyltransferase complex dimerization subunit type 1 TsaB [Peptococcaceae bacterium]